LAIVVVVIVVPVIVIYLFIYLFIYLLFTVYCADSNRVRLDSLSMSENTTMFWMVSNEIARAYQYLFM